MQGGARAKSTPRNVCSKFAEVHLHLVVDCVAVMRLVGVQIENRDAVCVGDVQWNLDRAAAQIRSHTSDLPTLYVLSELFTIGYARASFDALDALAETVESSVSVRHFQIVCAELDAKTTTGRNMISFGMPRREAATSSRAIFICNVVVGASRIEYYDKLHMANHGVCAEPQWFVRGKTGVKVFDFGDGTVVGISICYDARFPLMWTRLARLGAHVIIAPCAWPRDSGFDSWHHTIISRATETQCFVMSVNRAGSFFGASILVGPWYETSRRRLLTRDDQVPEPVVLGVSEGALVLDRVDLKYIDDIRHAVSLREDELNVVY
jgi:predicted amidohydrolase